MNQNPKVLELMDKLVSNTLIGDYKWYRCSNASNPEIQNSIASTLKQSLSLNTAVSFWFSNQGKLASLIADTDGRYFLLIKNQKDPNPALIRIDTVDYNRLRVVIENQLLNHPEINKTIDDFLNS